MCCNHLSRWDLLNGITQRTWQTQDKLGRYVPYTPPLPSEEVVRAVEAALRERQALAPLDTWTWKADTLPAEPVPLSAATRELMEVGAGVR